MKKITDEEIEKVVDDIEKFLPWYKSDEFKEIVNDKGLSFPGIFGYLAEDLMDLAHINGVNPYHFMAYAILRRAKSSYINEDHDIIAKGIHKFIEEYLDNYKFDPKQ